MEQELLGRAEEGILDLSRLKCLTCDSCGGVEGEDDSCTEQGRLGPSHPAERVRVTQTLK